MNSNNKPGEDCNCNCCINRRQIEEDKNNYYVKIYIDHGDGIKPLWKEKDLR